MAAGFCYLGNMLCFIGLIISIITVLVEKESKIPRFHAFQSILMTAGYIAMMITYFVFSSFASDARMASLAGFLAVMYLIGILLWFVLTIFLSIQGFRGKITTLPLIGDLADKWSGI